MIQTRNEIYSVEKTPSWVKKYAVPSINVDDNSPFSFPLVDCQDYVSEGEIFSYRRTYQCINDASRIEDASLHLVELHQGSQQLMIHELVIVRDGIRINALDHENITAIQREVSLENHITDNRITVSISIDDLRVEDHVEFCSTVVERKNEHPFHGSHFSTNYSLSWSCPVSLQVIRVVNNSDLPLSVLHRELSEEISGPRSEIIEPNQEYEKEYTDLPNERIPDTAPSWIWGSFLQISSTLEWRDLSKYLHSYFEKNGALSSLPASEVETLDLFSHEDNVNRKALKIIRFVQNNIRYRGENHGVFTHTPKSPKRTLVKRAGDCKDKSNLMMAMLSTIGVKARLVLVNTSYGKKIREFNPSPYHFNHMIVDINIENQHYYVDATIQKQAGNFQNLAQLDYGAGLPLTEYGHELVDIRRPLSNKVFELVHRFSFPRKKSETTMEIERTYYLHRADNMRSYFSSNEKLKYQQDFLEWAQNDTGLNLEIIEPIDVVEDDNILNKLIAVERYQIVDLDHSHKDKPIELMTDFIHDFLVPQKDEFPVRLDFDGIVQHDIFAQYDSRPDLQLTKEKIDTESFEYLDIVENVKGDQVHYLTRVTPLKSYVEAGEANRRYKKAVERIRQRSNNLINHKNKTASERNALMLVFFIAIFVFVRFIISEYS